MVSAHDAGMALTNAQILDLIDAVLTNRANADFYEQYGEAGNSFRGMKISDLLEARDRYADRLAAETGTGIGAPRHSLAEIFPQ